jgi:hypothetical protein
MILTWSGCIFSPLGTVYGFAKGMYVAPPSALPKKTLQFAHRFYLFHVILAINNKGSIALFNEKLLFSVRYEPNFKRSLQSKKKTLYVEIIFVRPSVMQDRRLNQWTFFHLIWEI